MGLIIAIIVIGLGSGHGTVANYHTSIPAPGGIAGFFAALVAALWAYDGWNNVSMVASEVHHPQRNLPRALILGTLAVIVIYLLANLTYFYVLPAAGVAANNRVAAETMRQILGAGGANAVSIAAMISIFAALNGSILSGSRVPFAMARDRLFFRRVAFVHPQHRTPSVSILLLSAWGALLALSGRYDELYNYVIFGSVILYGMATAAVIVLRFKRPEMHRPYRTIGYPVVPIRYLATLFGGVMAGLGGAYMSLSYSPLWAQDMTAGRGWIALALVVFAAWRPLWLLVGAYLFGSIMYLSLYVQGLGVPIPSPLVSMLTYIVTIVVLVIISRDVRRIRVNQPASLGHSFHATA